MTPRKRMPDSKKVPNSTIHNMPLFKKQAVVQKVTIQNRNKWSKAMTLIQLCKVLGKFWTVTLKIWQAHPEESLETLLRSRSLGLNKRNNKCKLKKFNETQRVIKSQNRKLRKFSLKPKPLILRNHSRPRSLKRRKQPRPQLMAAIMFWKTKSLQLITKIWIAKLFNLCKLKMAKPHGSSWIKKSQIFSELSAPKRETK